LVTGIGYVANRDINFQFTTGSPETAGSGAYGDIAASREINYAKSTVGNLIIDPGVTLHIGEEGSLNVPGDLIIYGSLVNEGSITVDGNIYVNNYNDIQVGTQGVTAGKFQDTGSLVNGSLVVGEYPQPYMEVSPDSSGNINSSLTEFTIKATPYMDYHVNGQAKVMESDGEAQSRVPLNYGVNNVLIKAVDPFGNISQKTVTLNNTSTPLTVTGSYPGKGYTGMAVDRGVWVRFDRNIQASQKYSDIMLLDSEGNKVPTTASISGDRLIISLAGQELVWHKLQSNNSGRCSR
jgi:hypothetical protein